MTKVSFNNTNSPFFTTLKQRVNQYFVDEKIAKTGNRHLYIKSGIQILSAISLYTVLVFFTPGTAVALALCALLGINMAMLGFNVMHEGGHQTFSRHKWINTASAYMLNILGGNRFFWKIKHNINHHTYTNIEGMDADIDVKPFMRLHENQSKKPMHRFQHVYCFLLYGLSHASWIFYDDFTKYFSGTIAPGKKRPIDRSEHVIFWLTKASFVMVYLVIPMLFLGVLPVIIGFLVCSFACGLTLAVTFQLAHVVEGTDFHAPEDQAYKIEHEWAIHQIMTTANFGTKSRILSWMLGGLNFQVEHHLFPRISHVHYPKINKLVQETCAEYKITYIEYSSMLKAIGSHVAHIKKMGKLS